MGCAVPYTRRYKMLGTRPQAARSFLPGYFWRVRRGARARDVRGARGIRLRARSRDLKRPPLAFHSDAMQLSSPTGPQLRGNSGRISSSGGLADEIEVEVRQRLSHARSLTKPLWHRFAAHGLPCALGPTPRAARPTTTQLSRRLAPALLTPRATRGRHADAARFRSSRPSEPSKLRPWCRRPLRRRAVPLSHPWATGSTPPRRCCLALS